jgi:hypothetical protein
VVATEEEQPPRNSGHRGPQTLPGPWSIRWGGGNKISRFPPPLLFFYPLISVDFSESQKPKPSGRRDMERMDLGGVSMKLSKKIL